MSQSSPYENKSERKKKKKKKNYSPCPISLFRKSISIIFQMEKLRQKGTIENLMKNTNLQM